MAAGWRNMRRCTTCPGSLLNLPSPHTRACTHMEAGDHFYLQPLLLCICMCVWDPGFLNTYQPINPRLVLNAGELKFPCMAIVVPCKPLLIVTGFLMTPQQPGLLNGYDLIYFSLYYHHAPPHTHTHTNCSRMLVAGNICWRKPLPCSVILVQALKEQCSQAENKPWMCFLSYTYILGFVFISHINVAGIVMLPFSCF